MISDEEYSDHSNEEGDVEEILIEDILFISQKRKWKARWCQLCNGALLIKGKKEDQDSKKDILLSGCEVRIAEPVHRKDYVFILVTPYEELLFAVNDEDSLNQWISSINDCKDKTVTVQTKKRKQGKLMRVTKSVGGKVATSSAGKKIIKDMIGKDGVKVINIIKKVVTDLYDKNRAKEIENDIIRIGVKFILLFRNEDITANDISGLKPRIQKLWHLSQDYAHIINFDYNAQPIQEAANLVFELLRHLLNQRISERNMEMLNELQGFLFSAKILDYLFTGEETRDQRRLLADILERHYNF